MKLAQDISHNPRNFQELLEAVYSERLRRNPRYSLRAFAISIGVNDSTLHQFMGGKRRITPRAALKIGLRLGLDPSHVTELVAAKDTSPKFDILKNDQFRFISRWYYDAILDLAFTKGFQSDPAWIGRRLHLPVQEVRIALETLRRLGFIHINEDAQIKVNLEDSLYNFEEGELTTEAAMQYQIEMLEKSIVAIRETPRALRNHTSFTVKISKASVQKFSKKIKALQKELVNEMKAETGIKDEVYSLQFSFFPLTK